MTAPIPPVATANSTSSHPAPAAPKPGRPSLFCPERTAAICANIRAEGISDSAAGALAGVTASTLSRWKVEEEGFALELEQARAWYEGDLVRKIRETRKRDGAPDWRAQAWLLRHSSPEGYGPRSRVRKVKEPPVTRGQASSGRENSAKLPESRGALSENRAILPETPAERGADAAAFAGPGEAVAFKKHAILPKSPGAVSENHAILPETPAAPVLRLSRQERRAEERRQRKALRQAMKEAA